MNKLSKDPIDQFFKEALKSPDLKYSKQDWKGLEARLPRKSKKKAIAWLLPAAAALLIFVSLWLSDGLKTEDKPSLKLALNPQKTGVKRPETDNAKNIQVTIVKGKEEFFTSRFEYFIRIGAFRNRFCSQTHQQ